MKTIDLDASLEPLLKVTIGGKEYEVQDIAPSLVQDMLAGATEEEGFDRVYDILTKILGAPKAELAKLGIRKLNLLLKGIMTAIEEEGVEAEAAAKNAQEAGEGQSS